MCENFYDSIRQLSGYLSGTHSGRTLHTHLLSTHSLYFITSNNITSSIIVLIIIIMQWCSQHPPPVDQYSGQPG